MSTAGAHSEAISNLLLARCHISIHQHAHGGLCKVQHDPAALAHCTACLRCNAWTAGVLLVFLTGSSLAHRGWQRAALCRALVSLHRWTSRSHTGCCQIHVKKHCSHRWYAVGLWAPSAAIAVHVHCSRMCRVDHASDFFTLSGSLLEADLQKASELRDEAEKQKSAPRSTAVTAAVKQQPGTSAGRPADNRVQQRASSGARPAAVGRAADPGATGGLADVVGSARTAAAAQQLGQPQPVTAVKAEPNAAAAVALAGTHDTKQPEHRKKNKRRDGAAEPAGQAVNGSGKVYESAR